MGAITNERKTPNVLEHFVGLALKGLKTTSKISNCATFLFSIANFRLNDGDLSSKSEKQSITTSIHTIWNFFKNWYDPINICLGDTFLRKHNIYRIYEYREITESFQISSKDPYHWVSVKVWWNYWWLKVNKWFVGRND